jgi:hypothetical protein
VGVSWGERGGRGQGKGKGKGTGKGGDTGYEGADHHGVFSTEKSPVSHVAGEHRTLGFG